MATILNSVVSNSHIEMPRGQISSAFQNIILSNSRNQNGCHVIGKKCIVIVLFFLQITRFSRSCLLHVIRVVFFKNYAGWPIVHRQIFLVKSQPIVRVD